MNKVLLIDNKKIYYKIVRKKVKNINLTVKPDCSVLVSASPKISMKTIDKFVLEKADWIKRGVEKYESKVKNSPFPDEFITGDIVTILDKNYKIRIVISDLNEVIMSQRTIYIYTNDINSTEKISRIYKKWINQLCLAEFTNSTKRLVRRFEKYGVLMPEIKIRNMKSCWGVCDIRKKTITINTNLIKMDRSLIDCVVAHELSHLVYPNHSKDFYNLLVSVMGDYFEKKDILEMYTL